MSSMTGLFGSKWHLNVDQRPIQRSSPSSELEAESSLGQAEVAFALSGSQQPRPNFKTLVGNVPAPPIISKNRRGTAF